MAFRIVLVSFPVLFVSGCLMRSVAERLVFGEAAHANPDRFCLRFNFQWSFVRFDDSAHCQKPRCQNTECRSMLRTGIAQDGFNRVSSNKDSLKKIPARGNNVTKDHVQNKRAPKRLRPRIFHAHQQAVNMPIAMKPAAERARNSCSRRIPNTSCRCCGTTKHVQSSAITPAAKAPPVTRAARGEAISKFRHKYPANGSMNTAVKAIPQAGSQ